MDLINPLSGYFNLFLGKLLYMCPSSLFRRFLPYGILIIVFLLLFFHMFSHLHNHPFHLLHCYLHFFNLRLLPAFILSIRPFSPIFYAYGRNLLFSLLLSRLHVCFFLLLHSLFLHFRFFFLVRIMFHIHLLLLCMFLIILFYLMMLISCIKVRRCSLRLIKFFILLGLHS